MWRPPLIVGAGAEGPRARESQSAKIALAEALAAQAAHTAAQRQSVVDARERHVAARAAELIAAADKQRVAKESADVAARLFADGWEALRAARTPAEPTPPAKGGARRKG